MIEIALQNLQKYYGANQVLKNVSFEVSQGEKVGLLGRNGSGKTTLFKILAESEGYDGGSKMMRRGATIGLLDQIPHFPHDYTTLRVLMSAFDKLLQIAEEMRSMEKRMTAESNDNLLVSYGLLQQAFESGGGYALEEKLAKVCEGLKIDDAMIQKTFTQLSGGQKTRVMLARLMLRGPDILLLDEPTNHLDLNSIEWLEEYLLEFPGTCLIISHDRFFLDRTVSRIVELVQGATELYEGNYSYYVKEKQERYESQLGRYKQEQKQIRQLEEAAKRMHDWAQRANNDAMHRRAFSIEKRIARMDQTAKPEEDEQMKNSFAEEGFAGKEIIVAKGLHKAYQGVTVLKDLNLLVRKDEQLAILGANGSGKTTLMRLIAGEENPDSGTIRIGNSVKAAYLPQIVAFADPELTVLETVMTALGMGQGQARNLLARYLFRNEEVYKTVARLSGGEQSRLRLCLMMQQDVNLLLLDEPTNHLDIDSREWLEAALEDYSGTLVFVSHDRYFIRKFAGKVAEIEGGSLVHYDGDYDYYREQRTRRTALREKTTLPTVHSKKQPVKTGPKPHDKVSAPRVKRSIPMAKEAETGATPPSYEAEILHLEKWLLELEQARKENSEDYAALGAIYEEELALQKKLNTLYGKWAEWENKSK